MPSEVCAATKSETVREVCSAILNAQEQSINLLADLNGAEQEESKYIEEPLIIRNLWQMVEKIRYNATHIRSQIGLIKEAL